MVVALNFLELGSSALSVGSTWYIAVAARADNMSNAVGGWSACLGLFLRTLLLGPLSIQTVGVPFRVDDRIYTLYARLTNLVADGEGLKVALDVKGYGLRAMPF